LAFHTVLAYAFVQGLRIRVAVAVVIRVSDHHLSVLSGCGMMAAIYQLGGKHGWQSTQGRGLTSGKGESRMVAGDSHRISFQIIQRRSNIAYLPLTSWVRL
jgi:hypothetical protein